MSINILGSVGQRFPLDRLLCDFKVGIVSHSPGLIIRILKYLHADNSHPYLSNVLCGIGVFLNALPIMDVDYNIS